METVSRYFSENWQWLFGAATILIAGGVALTNLRTSRNKPDTSNDSARTAEIVDALVRRHIGELSTKDEEIGALTKAVEALAKTARTPNPPPGIDDALARLKDGDTEAAEEVLRQVKERRKAEGEAAFKEAAAAARHIGALAFLHDTAMPPAPKGTAFRFWIKDRT